RGSPRGTARTSRRAPRPARARLLRRARRRTSGTCRSAGQPTRTPRPRRPRGTRRRPCSTTVPPQLVSVAPTATPSLAVYGNDTSDAQHPLPFRDRPHHGGYACHSAVTTRDGTHRTP